MHTNHTPDDPDVLKEMGFDRRDIDGKNISKWIVAFFAFSIAMFVISIPIYRFFAPQQNKWARGEELPTYRKVPQAPNPILQDNITTKVDIAVMRQEELKKMGETTWIDRDKQIVRIPVDRAIDLIAERGVSTGEAVKAESPGNTIKQNATGPAK